MMQAGMPRGPFIYEGVKRDLIVNDGKPLIPNWSPGLPTPEFLESDNLAEEKGTLLIPNSLSVGWPPSW